MARILRPCVQMGSRVIVWWFLHCPETILRSRFLTGVIGLPLIILVGMVRWALERITGVLSVAIRKVEMLFSLVWITLSPGPFRLLIFELVLWRIIQRFLMVFRLGIPLSLIATRVFSSLISASGSVIVMISFFLVEPILSISWGVLFLPRLTLILLCLSLSLINHFE